MTAQQKAEGVLTATALHGEGLRSNYVLVAEDDPMYRHILRNWLERWGYQALLAGDGKQARRLLQNEPRPNLLVFD